MSPRGLTWTISLTTVAALQAGHAEQPGALRAQSELKSHAGQKTSRETMRRESGGWWAVPAGPMDTEIAT